MSVSFDEYGFFNGVWEFNQVNWAKMMSPTVPDGVMGGIGDELQVWADSTGMMVHVKTGECRIRGHRGSLESPVNLTIAAADSVNPRIDLVVARVTYGSPSTMVLDVLTGTAAEEPVAPTVTQVAGDTWEIPLAMLSIPANSTTITADDVTDARFIQSTSTAPFTNASPDTLLKGELVVLSTTTANAVERCPAGGIPIGVVASGAIEAGAVGQIATVNGSVVEAKCTDGAVAVGDMLVGSTAGQAAADSNSHNAYGVGYALEAKEAGAVGNVKTLLGVMVKLRNTNKWYLADGLTEENVTAAWKFKYVNTLEEALVNVNNSRIDCTLTVYGNVTKWERWVGLTFPAEVDCYVNCGYRIWNSAVSCAFGFENMATGSVVTAGTTYGFYGNSCASYLLAKGGYISGSTKKYYNHCMNVDTTNQYINQSGTLNASGVLACNWPTVKGATGGAMYYNGVKQSTSQAATVIPFWGKGWKDGRVFTTCSNSGLAMGEMNLNCLVFYRVNLTDAQHAQIYEQMKALGLAG